MSVLKVNTKVTTLNILTIDLTDNRSDNKYKGNNFEHTDS